MGRVLYVVTVEVSPASESAWDAWHTQQHMPQVLAQPGFMSARKYKDAQFAMGRWSRYVINYELQDFSAFERYSSSEAAHRLRQEHIDAFGLETRVTRQVLHERTALLLAAGRAPPVPAPRPKPAAKSKAAPRPKAAPKAKASPAKRRR
jgi:hypothetical protein